MVTNTHDNNSKKPFAQTFRIKDVKETRLTVAFNAIVLPGQLALLTFRHDEIHLHTIWPGSSITIIVINNIFCVILYLT